MRGRLGVLVVAVAVLAAAPSARAGGGDPPPPPVSVTTDPDGMQHMHFVYGPLAAAPGQNLILAGPQSVATPPEDGYIVGFKPGLVGEDLQTPPPVEQVHMHHAVFLNLSRQDATRPELPERMFAFAEEKTQGRVPAPYGYPFKASDVLAINYMLHNETPDSRHVFITYDMDFVPAGTPLAAKMKPARPLWLDVENGKAYPVFDVLRGQRPRRPLHLRPSKGDWTVDHSGSLVVTAGHVHPGGLWTDLDLLRGDRRSHLFRSEAKYFDPNGAVSWDMAMTMTPPDWKVAVDKGDKLHVSATYDTTRASWYESMGIMLAFMVDDQDRAADPFGHRFATTGKPTHGELGEATHFGGTPTSLPDPAKAPAGGTVDSRVGIASFAYLPGDMSTLTQAGRADRARRPGPALRQPRRGRLGTAHGHGVPRAVHGGDRRVVPAGRRRGRLRLRRARVRAERLQRRQERGEWETAEEPRRGGPTPTSAASTRSCAARSASSGRARPPRPPRRGRARPRA